MFVAVETNIDWKIHINLIKVQHIVQKKEAQREPTIHTLYKSNQNYSSNHQHTKTQLIEINFIIHSIIIHMSQFFPYNLLIKKKQIQVKYK